VADVTGDFIGQGWRFPVKPDAQGRLNWVSGDEEIRQSIWLIMTTSPGERQMRPEFGCGIHDLVFDANTAALHGLVQANVQSALLRWEPRIDVVNVRVEAPPDQRNLLLIHVDYRIRANNAFFNLVYPFFLIEGAN
jgi:phage baseplate assembly protein W